MCGYVCDQSDTKVVTFHSYDVEISFVAYFFVLFFVVVLMKMSCYVDLITDVDGWIPSCLKF